MPNTLSTNPDMISLDRNDAEVWRYPATPELDKTNPATQARDEYIQHQYIEELAAPEEVVNQFETVTAAGEIAGYATNNGSAIDPAHSEAVLAEATTAVKEALAADPDMLAMHRANEEQRMNREQHAAAVKQATIYAPQISGMRDRALLDWGAAGEA